MNLTEILCSSSLNSQSQLTIIKTLLLLPWSLLKMKIYKKPAKYELNYRTDRKWCWDKYHTNEKTWIYPPRKCALFDLQILHFWNTRAHKCLVCYKKNFWGQDSLYSRLHGDVRYNLESLKAIFSCLQFAKFPVAVVYCSLKFSECTTTKCLFLY